jgi:hypothetical protein
LPLGVKHLCYSQSQIIVHPSQHCSTSLVSFSGVQIKMLSVQTPCRGARAGKVGRPLVAPSPGRITCICMHERDGPTAQIYRGRGRRSSWLGDPAAVRHGCPVPCPHAGLHCMHVHAQWRNDILLGLAIASTQSSIHRPRRLGYH